MGFPFRRAAVLSLLAAWLSPGAALAEEGGPPRPDREDPGAFLSFTWENDLAANTDQDYTNGFRFSYTSSEAGVPNWLTSVGNAFPLFPAGASYRASFVVGQSIFTPEDIAATDPDPHDRPYAGWLYGGVGLLADSGRIYDRLELLVGVVGPWSQAEQVQNGVHSVIGSQKAEGWDYQLHNEVGGVLTYERAWRGVAGGEVLGLSYDLTPNLGASLGTILTQAQGGAMLRLGEDLPLDYGPPRVSPSIPGSDFFIPTAGFGWYFFAGLEGRAVARNIFLDGNTWEDSRHVDKYVFVGDLSGGVAMTINNVRIAYTQVLRSPEFEGDGATSFGAISLSWRF